MKFQTVVVIECETQAQADEVLTERLGHDEDYGFDYTLDWEAPKAQGYGPNVASSGYRPLRNKMGERRYRRA